MQKSQCWIWKATQISFVWGKAFMAWGIEAFSCTESTSDWMRWIWWWVGFCTKLYLRVPKAKNTYVQIGFEHLFWHNLWKLCTVSQTPYELCYSHVAVEITSTWLPVPFANSTVASCVCVCTVAMCVCVCICVWCAVAMCVCVYVYTVCVYVCVCGVCGVQ